MVKGLYTIHDEEAAKQARKNDTSYKSCIITMFIVFLLCVIIFLLLWRTRTPYKDYSPEYSDDGETFERIYAQQSPYDVTTEDNSHSKTTTSTTTVTYRRTALHRTTESQFAKIVQASTPPPTTTMATTTSAITTTMTTTAAATTETTQLPFSTSVHTFSPKNTTTSTTPSSILLTSEIEDDYTSDDGRDYETLEGYEDGNQTANDNLANHTTTSSGISTSTSIGGLQQSTLSDDSKETTTMNSSISGTQTSPSSTVSNTTFVTTLIRLGNSTTTLSTEGSTTPVKLLLNGIQNSTTELSTSDSEYSSDDSLLDTESTTETDTVIPLVKTTPTSTTNSNQFFNSTTSINTIATTNSTTTIISNVPSSTTVSSQISNSVTSSILNNVSSTTQSSVLILLHQGLNSTTETTENTDDQTTDVSNGPSTTVNTIDQPETCETSECKTLTSKMLSLMNHSMDPCENFYEFACGGLRGNPTLLQENPQIDVWNRISRAIEKIDNSSATNQAHQKFRHFYEQCLNYEHDLNKTTRLDQARKVVLEVGNMYNGVQWKAMQLNFNLTDILVKMFKLNSAPLFDLLLDVNPHDPSKFQLKLTLPPRQTKLQLESPMAAQCKSFIEPDDPHNIDLDTVYKTKYHPCTRHFADYLKIVEEAVEELKLFDNTTDLDISQMIGFVKIFIETEIFSLFENVPEWKVKNNLQEKSFMPVDIEELNVIYPKVKWEVLFSALLDISPIDKDTKVQLYFQKEYFNKLFEELDIIMADENTSLILYNGLLAMFAHDLYVDLVEPRPCNREEYCLKIASGLMEDISSSLYLSTFDPQELSVKGHELVTLFDQLKNILRDEIQHAEWLDDESRSAAVNKLDKMTAIADGGTGIFNNPSYLNNQINRDDLKPENSFLENCIELLRRYRSLLYNIYEGDPTETTNIWTFFLLPYDTHPTAIYELNTVIIPYGLVGSWKPSKHVPSFVFKARIGNEIARQITHHFNTVGIQFGAENKDPDFIRKDDYNAMYEQCENNIDMALRSWTNQQKKNYIYKVNALRTMNEHITDNSALWLTHKLFNKSAETEPLLPWLDMSHDKVYFLLAAQEFCAKAELVDYTITMFESEQMPPYLRVENMILNSPVFGHAYNCPAGGNQNPTYKCPPFPEADDEDYIVPKSPGSA